MIVVEGPDGAGKSTLVQTLCDQFGFTVGTRATKNRDELYKVTRQDTYCAIAEDLRGDSPLPKIWDRLFWSELVYADLVRRPIEFGMQEQYVIKKVLAITSFTVVCLPPFDTVLKNVSESKHEMEGVREKIQKIYTAYPKAFLHFPGHLVYYDYTGHKTTSGYAGMAEILNRCKAHIHNRKERVWTP